MKECSASAIRMTTYSQAMMMMSMSALSPRPPHLQSAPGQTGCTDRLARRIRPATSATPAASPEKTVPPDSLRRPPGAGQGVLTTDLGFPCPPDMAVQQFRAYNRSTST